jgi:hypothetical protein
MRLQLHSMTDLITNSSTVIYTYSDASLDACKDMINEIFKTFGIDKTCDDVFRLSVELEDSDPYYSAISNLDEGELPEELNGWSTMNWEKQGEALESFLQKVRGDTALKPQWMKDAEKGDGYDSAPATDLNIEPKAPEYEKLAELVRAFLYSTNHEAVYNG